MLGYKRAVDGPTIRGMSDTETIKTVVRDLIDGLFAKGDLAAVDEDLSEDFVDHDPPFGVSAFRRFG
jgi:hypothetical protein